MTRVWSIRVTWCSFFAPRHDFDAKFFRSLQIVPWICLFFDAWNKSPPKKKSSQGIPWCLRCLRNPGCHVLLRFALGRWKKYDLFPKLVVQWWWLLWWWTRKTPTLTEHKAVVPRQVINGNQTESSKSSNLKHFYQIRVSVYQGTIP